jgi:hypothetical protein
VPAVKGSLWRMLAAAALVGGVSTGVALAANTASFADPSGDSDRSPDVTAVAISSDDAGTITVKLTVLNRSALAGDEGVGFGLDVDQNPDSGSYYYGIEYELDLQGSDLAVLRASPDGGLTDVAVPASFHGSFAGGVATLTFKASDFGVASGFNLYAVGFDRDSVDFAPNIRTVNYQLSGGTAPPALSRDRRAPVDEALKATGVHAKIAELGYYASDGRGETADSIAIYRGKRVLKRINYRLEDTNPFLPYVARWSVPKKTRGKLRFCVRSADRAGNKSNTSCAALTIK